MGLGREEHKVPFCPGMNYYVRPLKAYLTTNRNKRRTRQKTPRVEVTLSRRLTAVLVVTPDLTAARIEAINT